jgi:PAS domain S-box-containing protein
MKKKSNKLSKAASAPKKKAEKKTIAVRRTKTSVNSVFRIVKKTASAKSAKKLPGSVGKAPAKKTDTRLKYALRELKELKAQLKQRDKKCKDAERRFEADVTKYKAIVDNSLSALLLGKPDGSILEVNQAACDMFGYKAKEFVKIKRKDFIETNAATLQKLKERTETKKAVGELIGIRKNGKRFPCQISSVIFTAADGQDYSSTAIFDISEKKKQEEAILEANLHMQMILDNTGESFFVVDRNLNILTFNKTAQTKARQLIGKEFKKGDHILNFAMTDRMKELKKMYAYILEGNTYYYKYIAHNKKKEEVVLGLHFSPVRINDRIIAIMVNARDITTEVKQEKELLQSEERYRLLFYNNPLPMWVFDTETYAFLEVNDATIKHYGYSRKEFLSMTIFDIRPKDEINELIKRTSKFEGMPGPHTHAGDWHHIKKNGEKINVEVTSHRINYNGRSASLILAHDISARIKAEKEKEFNIRNTEALINSTHDLIWSIDTEKRLIIGNNSFLKFIEIHTGKKLGPGVELLKVDYFSEAEIKHWDALYSRALSGESFSVINSLKTESGEIWSETYFDPILQNDTVLGAAMYTKNITDRKKLEDQRALYVSIVNSSEDAILSKTLDGTIISWNKGAQKLFGYTAQEAIGKNITILIPPALEKEETRILNELKTEKHIENLETVRMRKDGSLVNISLTVSPITDSNGHVVGASKIARDISERKRSEEQIQKHFKEISDYKFALDESSIVAITDAKGTITYANENFCRISRFSREELIGQNHRIINSGFHPKEFFADLWKTIASGNVWRGEIKNKRKDGTYYWVDTTIVPFLDKNGKPYQYVAIRSDITERKEADEQLATLNLELKKRAEELSNSNSELEQFAYVASHDLQEPLRMVSSFLQLLQKKSEKELDETSNKYIHYAVDGAERMKGLILDLLQYSRAGTSNIVSEPIQMNELVDEVLMLYKNSDAEFDIGPLPTIQAGKTAMTQLMQNLIGNGIKYRSDRKPKVRVYAEENETEWKFTVEDNGIGINPKFYEKIFVVFQRLHNKDKYGGTGVGLAICKKIVERYKGKIWVDSVPGEGSKFIFTIAKNQTN